PCATSVGRGPTSSRSASTCGLLRCTFRSSGTGRPPSSRASATPASRWGSGTSSRARSSGAPTTPSAPSVSSRLVASALGRVGYLGGWRLQEAVATRVRAGGPDRLLLLEHDPVYTIGRRGSESNLIAPPDVLRRSGASVYRVDRGGDITYHGPGQLGGYPVVALARRGDLVRGRRAPRSP